MKNIDIINKMISNKLSIDEKVVTKINKFYWKTIRKKLSSLDNVAVFVKGFTTFTLSRYNLRKEITDTIGKIRNVPNSNKFKESTKIIYINTLRERLTKLLILRNKLAKIYNNEHYIGIPITDTESVEKC